MNPHLAFIQDFQRWMEQGRHLPEGMTPSALPPPGPGSPTLLFFAPHPDDECLTGALPLRLSRKCQHRIIVVSVTLGSRQDRRQERQEEQQRACQILGFEWLPLQTGAYGDLGPQAQAEIAHLLIREHPWAVILPHQQDQHRTHQATHQAVVSALAQARLAHITTVETDFWQPLPDPNLLVESSPEEVATLIAALSCHRGELIRNPYHIQLPAWLVDNVRRGTERIGGQGAIAPSMAFGTLYRLRPWIQGRPGPCFAPGRFLSTQDDIVPTITEWSRPLAR